MAGETAASNQPREAPDGLPSAPARKILVVGIGAGNPEHMTIQGVEALNRADVIFIPGKGAEKDGLAKVRRDICERFIRNKDFRSVGFDVPKRRAATNDYGQTVSDWHDAVEAIYARLLMEEMGEGQCGAFLVWGDPTLYDSTLRILDRLRARGVAFDYEIIPGITSVQALSAAHRVALNRIGEPITITTGRRLAEAGFPDNADSVVVMLDGETAFNTLDGETEIWWGAYVGTPDEILVHGRLAEVAGEIERVRAEARESHGWIMDIYMLRRPG